MDRVSTNIGGGRLRGREPGDEPHFAAGAHELDVTLRFEPLLLQALWHLRPQRFQFYYQVEI